METNEWENVKKVLAGKKVVVQYKNNKEIKGILKWNGNLIYNNFNGEFVVGNKYIDGKKVKSVRVM